MNEDKKQYLQMIQEPISRMSSISVTIKGFTATIITGLTVISFSEIKTIILILAFMPILAFTIMDIYYLSMERKFRYLYNCVLDEKHDVNFSLELMNEPLDIISARARFLDCLKSPSIYLFYPLVYVVYIITIILKVGGVL